MTDEPVIHTTRPGEIAARCGAADGVTIAWEQVNDPDHPATFTCGACWLDVSGGREPMGGTAP